MPSKRRADSLPPPLVAGPYRPPAYRAGGWINDELLGLVEVFGSTNGPLTWPRIRRKGPPAPVLTDELARAVRIESESAVAYWWGVSTALVQRWRRELGVGRTTPGTSSLIRERCGLTPEGAARGRAAMTAESRERAAAKRRGKPANDAIREALLRGARKPKSPEWAARANAWMLAGKARAKKSR